MTSMVALSCPGSSGPFFQRLHARTKWNNFAIVLSLSFLFWIKIEETSYLSAIINAGLLRHLTLGVSHDNYRKEIYIHVELCLQLQLFFKGSEVSRSEVWGLKFRGLSFRDTPFVSVEIWIQTHSDWLKNKNVNNFHILWNCSNSEIATFKARI